MAESAVAVVVTADRAMGRIRQLAHRSTRPLLAGIGMVAIAVLVGAVDAGTALGTASLRTRSTGSPSARGDGEAPRHAS